MKSSHYRVIGQILVSTSLFVSASAAFGQGNQHLRKLPFQMPASLARSLDVGPTSPSQALHVALSLNPRNPIGLQAYADAVSNPRNRLYGRYLTPAEFGKTFGASQADVDKVAAYLKRYGFKISLIAAGHLQILADCNVAEAEQAFHSTIDNYHLASPMKGESGDFYSFNKPLQVPSDMAPVLCDISGLEDAYKPVPRSNLGHRVSPKLAKQGQAGQTLTPTQARTLYNLAPIYGGGFTGKGRNVAISSFDGFALSNVPLFYSQFGLPSPGGGVGSNITVVTIDGGKQNGGAAGEGDLDIQMALGEAPLCSLTIYDGGGPLIDVLTREANDNLADVITESYGWILSTSGATACHNAHVQMTTQGTTYMEASGDSGTQLEPYAYSNYEPEVLQVGGTIATVTAAGTRTSEVGWSGSGGGWATDGVPFNVLPSWQKGKGVPADINFRLNPDVAIHADGVLNGQDAAGYWFFFGGQLQPVAGTSCASPTFAGALGDSEQKLISLGELTGKKRLGRISDLIYLQNGLPSVWYDITSGSNGTLPNGQPSQAKPFWDFVTGWGAPDWNAFVNTFGSVSGKTVIPAEVAIYANQGNSPSGGPAQLALVDQQYYSQGSVLNSSVGVLSAAVMTYVAPANAIAMSVNVVANGPYGTTNFIYLQNAQTGVYELVNTTADTGKDQSITFSVSNFQKYIGTGNQVKMVDRMVLPLRRGVQPFRMKLDLATLSITVNS